MTLENLLVHPNLKGESGAEFELLIGVKQVVDELPGDLGKTGVVASVGVCVLPLVESEIGIKFFFV